MTASFMSPSTETFAKRLLAWYRRHGRHDLPWQRDPSAYRVWISEIMLQQTQVGTVVPYYARFLERFPDIHALAEAPLDEVLRLWAGLGYYARARNLHRCAQLIVRDHGGSFPQEIEAVSALPGIGRSTAAAILAFAFGQHHAILDGNVKRVLSRHRGIEGWPGERQVEQTLWALTEALTPAREVQAYTQAVMDLGATVCIRGSPRCDACPLATDCEAHRQGRETAFPAPRPRRPLPVRRTCMLLVQDAARRVYLQRRPPSGIWGGLWGFPEIDVDEAAARWCESALGAKIISRQEWQVLRHSFTHFHLDIRPMHVFIDSAVSVVRDDDALWHHPAQTLPVGVASPVGALLAKLREISGEP